MSYRCAGFGRFSVPLDEKDGCEMVHIVLKRIWLTLHGKLAKIKSAFFITQLACTQG